MMRFVGWLQRNEMFKWFSSVRLAVPLLLVIGGVVAYGTILESQYNAAYAKLVIYNSLWFQGLLLLLGVNILLATVSRLPWKKRHTGFVVTHLGMLLLLAGSVVTKIYGIDGYLRVIEGAQGKQVVLDERIFEFSSESNFKKVLIPQRASKGEGFSSINKVLSGHFQILTYLPFVEVDQELPPIASSPGTAVRFALKSKFFDTTNWLHSAVRKEMQMGPLKVRLVPEQQSLANVQTNIKKASKKRFPAPKKVKATASTKKSLKIMGSDGGVIRNIEISELRKQPIKVGKVAVALVNAFDRAVVAENKLAGTGQKLNPAVELRVKAGDQTFREILFARFPNFSMAKGNETGLKFVYVAPQAGPEKESVGKQLNHAANTSSGEELGNVLEFILPESGGGPVTVNLYKGGKSLKTLQIAKGGKIVTPWMGIEVTLLEVGSLASSASEPRAIAPARKQDQLPPSALKIRPLKGDMQPFWLVEGRHRELEIGGENYVVFYGRNSIRLPFQLKLNKFFKRDYPGSNTALSFESHVSIDGSPSATVISMNEPLKREGFTLYQSSYDIRPNAPVASIFSVNRDPGRWIKYLGSLVMCLGIVTYVLMKSRVYKTRKV